MVAVSTEKKPKSVRFYAYTTGFILAKDPYIVISAPEVRGLDGQTRHDDNKIKAAQFYAGTFETTDEETIEFLRTYNDDPSKKRILIISEKVIKPNDTVVLNETIEKEVLPESIARLLDLKTLRNALKETFNFESEALKVEDLIQEAIAAGFIKASA